jgi:hypothetical protein
VIDLIKSSFLILIVAKKILDNLVQRISCMFFHIRQNILHGNGRLLLGHSCVGHYQVYDIAHGYSADVYLLFHNFSFYLDKMKNSAKRQRQHQNVVNSPEITGRAELCHQCGVAILQLVGFVIVLAYFGENVFQEGRWHVVA